MIQYIINTLNQIEVKGKDNMDRLLGAIMALESMLQQQNKELEEKAKKEGEVEDAG